ncbi:MAG: hypothetical protein ABS61_06905 [Microbacterium sp. SCN 70-18]|nr:hypothetical protein [Microbacterium chocolatum]ODT10745.1 MAG: hypothetical protein ABS61_06905 [Microbacterium sp. SCN 70-18]
MTEVTLTDRYIDATVRSVPERQRADLSAELRSSIADQIEARVEGGADPAEAERAVLTALGDPDRLAAEYADRPAFLIGPRYFFSWWRLLKLLLAIVPACAAVGVAIAQTLTGATVGEVIAEVVVVVLSVVVHVTFWTTLVFAIVERSARAGGAGVVAEWSIDALPEVRQSGARLSDLIATLVFLAAAAGAVLWDRFVGFAYADGRGWMPILDPGLWPWWIGGLFVVLVLEALLAVYVYAHGRWTLATAVANVALNAAIVIPVLWLLGQRRLIDPALFESGILSGDASTLETVVVAVVGVGAVVVAVWDSVDGFVKARRAR